MASIGTFGVAPAESGDTNNYQSRTTTQTVDNDILKDSKGRKLEITTHGQEKKISEKFYAGATLPALTEAVEAQNGEEVVTSEAIDEAAAGYATVTKDRLIVPGPAGA